MSIHYKFKNTKDYDAIKFDGVYITASDLKSTISQQKRLGNSELQLENEETKQIYTDDQMIPKNTNIIVSRLPFANTNKRARMASQHHTSNGNPSGNTNHHHHNSNNNNHHHHNNNHHHNNHHRQPAPSSSLSTMSDQSNGGGREALELVNTKNMTEEEKLKYVRLQSTKDFDPSRYARGGRGGGHRPGGRGGGAGGGRISVPPGYTCRRCGIPGHSIYDCRMNTMHKVKRSSGIPRDFLMKVDSKEKGALMTPSGEYAVPFIDREAYNNPKVEKAPFFEDGTPPNDAPVGGGGGGGTARS